MENKEIKEMEEVTDIIRQAQMSNTLQSQVDLMMKIIELPDETFDMLYQIVMNNFEKAFNNPNFEKQVLKSLNEEMYRNPNFDIEKEAESIQKFIDSLKEEENISDNKKKFLEKVLSSTIVKFVNLYQNPREKVKVKIEKLDENAYIPEYAHQLDAGADIKALEDTEIQPNETVLVRTGLKIAIPKGYEIQIRPRSGMSLKTGLRIANAPGTIDSSYRGEVGIIVTNTSSETYTIKQGEKIAQFVIAHTPMIIWEECKIDDETDRGEKGFGSTDA